MLEPTTQPEAPTDRRRGYGLPCVKCHTYYFADLDSCPVCRSRDRIGRPAPAVQADTAPVSSSATEPANSPASDAGLSAGRWSVILGKSSVEQMRTISAGEFRARCVQVLEEVGTTRATIVVTKRGKPVARIVPPEMSVEAPVSN
jgi:prevent-host-death family protein